MIRRMTCLLLLILCVAWLSGCTSVPTISHLREQNGELAYEECKIQLLNTVLLGIFVWSGDCQTKTLPIHDTMKGGIKP